MKKLLLENQSFVGKVYHGSGSLFDRFEQSKARLANDFYGGGVAYFTDNYDVAITYARSMAKKTQGDPIIYTVELKLDRVFDVDHEFIGQELKDILPKKLDDFLRGAGLMTLNSDPYLTMTRLSMGKMSLTGDQIFKGLSKGMNATAVARDYLIEKGYDGLRYNGGVNMGMATRHNVYLAYDADDITIVDRKNLATAESSSEIMRRYLDLI